MYVRYYVPIHRNTAVEVLAILSRDHYWGVHMTVAENLHILR